MAEVADFDVDGHRHGCIARAMGARCGCSADLFVVAQDLERALARFHPPLQRTRGGEVTDEHLAELAEVSGRHKRPWTMGVGSYVVAALVDEVRRLRAVAAGHRGPMTTDENTQPESTEVSVETPAKVTTDVEVDATPETAGAAEPDAATEAMEVESKEQPSE